MRNWLGSIKKYSKKKYSKKKYSMVAFVTVLALVITLASPGIAAADESQNKSQDVPQNVSVASQQTDTGKGTQAEAFAKKSKSAKSKKNRITPEQEIAAKTVEPESGQKYDGYIVIANDDLKADAEASGYTASTSGDYIKVDAPLDTLDFTDPDLVDIIIPNIEIQTEAYPDSTNDPAWPGQWSLYPYATTMSGITTGYGIGVSALYRRGLTGNGVKVGIFDTGLGSPSSSPHPDLRKDFTTEHGINFATLAGDPAPTGDPWPTSAYDAGQHGTAVAGFIAAVTNNATGVAGVASDVEVYPYRVFQSSAGSLYTIFYGLEYLIDNNELPDVINMSIGTDTSEFISMHLKKLFDEAAAKGTIVVAAAANRSVGSVGSFDYLSYPASFDSVISVGNSKSDGSLHATSHENEKVDVTAPGTDVYSLTPNGSYSQLGYGTSYSSPLVAGVAAALKQKDRSIDVYAFRELIKKTSRKIRIGSDAFPYDANGHSDSYGYGLIDAEAMLAFLEQPGLYRIKYDLDGGSFGKNCDPVVFATSGAFAAGIALPGASGEKPKKDGYVFAGWTIGGTAITTLTTAHRPASTSTPVEVKARWTAGTSLKASDFVIPFDYAVEIEDAGYYEGDSGYAKCIVSLSALAGVQTASGDPIVSADVNSIDYIETMGEGCYHVDFATSKGAFATVAMTVYKDKTFGGAAGIAATLYQLASTPGAPTSGASVIAHNFTVSLSAIGTANPVELADATAYTWQRSDNIIKDINSGTLTVEGFSSISSGGAHTVYFRSATIPGAVVSRSVTVINDLPTPHYTITYYGNGSASGSMATQSAVYGSNVTLLPVQYAKPGYVFAGWSTSPGEATPIYSNGHAFTPWTINSNLNLYAQWRPTVCTVSYYDETGAFLCSGTVNYGDSFYAPAWYGDKPGYTYLGWNTKLDGSGVRYTSTTPVTNHISVYPTWQPTYKSTTPTKSISLKASAPAKYVLTGKSMKLKAVFTGTPLSAAEKNVTWKILSTGGTGAKVNAKTGTLVAGTKEGMVKIRVTSVQFAGVSSDITVTVAKPVTKIRIPVTKLYVKKGASVTVPVAADNGSSVSARLTWTTSNAKVATVNASGSVKAVAPGKAVITAKSLNGKATSFTVYVVNKAKKIKTLTVKGVARSKVLKKGKTAQLKIKIKPATATVTKIAFKSSKPSVLSVDKAGKLIAKKKGAATIQVIVGNKSQKIKIKVK